MTSVCHKDIHVITHQMIIDRLEKIFCWNYFVVRFYRSDGPKAMSFMFIEINENLPKPFDP